MAISNATLGGLTRTELLEMHYKMSLLRRFEEKSAEEYTRGKIGGFMHLYIGQEAGGVGCMSTLRQDDKVLASYREHGLALASFSSKSAWVARPASTRCFSKIPIGSRVVRHSFSSSRVR